MNDLDLLRRFEPVVRYSQGEMFFPCAVDGYLQRCSLWERDAKGNTIKLIDYGQVTPERLAEFDHHVRGAELFLRFTDEPLDPITYQLWLISEDHPSFESVGRLSRVGFLGRLAEALFSFSLLIRGRVPGGTTGRAALQYKAMMADDPRYVYYGRVIRDGDYIILHYMFFYVMNDWRSSFHGVNDHEADWEQVFIYVTEEAGDYVPQWVAFAAHDFSGDDLRRRWDDPELHKTGDDRVVVYAGAGSHAAYIQPGEYLMNVEPEFMKPVKRVLTPISRFLAESLNTTGVAAPNQTNQPLLSLAFVDYARGDGRSIGPGETTSWSPELLSDDLQWVSAYHGLWGLDTRDPFGGERSPAGPKFNRDGTVRHAWADPLGWSGLDKVPAPANLVVEIEATISTLVEEAERTRSEIVTRRGVLRAQGLTVQALSTAANLEKQFQLAADELDKTGADIKALNDAYTELLEKIRFLEEYLDRIRAGDRGDPQAHLRHRATPELPPPKLVRLMDTWAAASGALLVMAVVLLVATRPAHWPLWIALVLLLFGFIEAGLRRKAVNYLLTATIILAAIGAMALVVEYWRWVIPGVLILIFLYSLVGNLRELRAR